MTQKKTIKDTSKSNHKPTIVNDHFHIVSLGASAGGLKAFEAFFKGMPTKNMTGMAFVLVQHLAPDHKSMLADLIRHYTPIEVFEVVDGMQVKPNCIYIIPPNYDMTIFNGCLQLLDPIAPHGHRLPIDLFLRSMAYEQRERSIAIILSGTGSDGTLGVRAIKAEGGMVMAQSPESAEFDGMPISAIDTGMVDYQLPPSEMATQLIAYINHLIEKRPTTIATHEWQNDTSLRNKIFALLRNQTSHDFSQYKPSTINRRIDRRLAVHQISNLKNYVKFLQHTPTEVDALFYDLLIGVTHFFRDKQAFNTLEKYIIPKLFSEVSEDKVIRIWSVGCSTGEEAYSIAILLREHMDKLKKDYKVQVFATDIDDRAIDFARVGIYPASIANDLSRERLDRFFIAESDSSAYRISKVIRNMLIFSEQDVIKDPPFSRLDLLCCRNLLIYFNTALQTKLISLFHFALNPNAVLMLGTSEGIGTSNLLFNELSHKEKLFQRTDCFPSDLHSVIDSLGLNNSLKKIERQNKSLSLKKIPSRQLSLRELTERAIISEIALASVLFNANGDILFLHGHSGSFLELISGEAVVNNVMAMARPGLRHEIKQAMRTAVGDKKTVRHPDLKVNNNGDINRFNMTLCPIMVDANLSSDNYLYLMIMESLPAEEKPLTEPPNSPLKPEAVLRSNSALQLHIAGLQDELHSKDQHLEITQRELEVTNQELNSTNEEMLSINEELQSTNEELKTSKEELQSINEELGTVNNELQIKVTDLSVANNDMNNLLAGTRIATVFVDHQLRILRFTPAADSIINLIPGDIGRPVGHIVSKLVSYENLIVDLQAVLDTLNPKEIDVQTLDKKWYNMHIQPYRTLNNVIEGAVISFIDVTDVRRIQSELLVSELKFRSLFDNIPIAVAFHKMIYDSAGNALDYRFLDTNESYRTLAGIDPKGKTAREISLKIDKNPFDWIGAFDQVVRTGKNARFEQRLQSSNYWCDCVIFRYKPEHFVTAFIDITPRKKAEEALEKTVSQLQKLKSETAIIN